MVDASLDPESVGEIHKEFGESSELLLYWIWLSRYVQLCGFPLISFRDHADMCSPIRV